MRRDKMEVYPKALEIFIPQVVQSLLFPPSHQGGNVKVNDPGRADFFDVTGQSHIVDVGIHLKLRPRREIEYTQWNQT